MYTAMVMIKQWQNKWRCKINTVVRPNVMDEVGETNPLVVPGIKKLGGLPPRVPWLLRLWLTTI